MIPMITVLAKSSNIGAIQFGMRVGQANMYKYSQAFGIGESTGIELPAESKGRLRKKWEPTSLASVSIGHEVSVTTLQLARACSVIANGGMLVKPQLILREGDQVLPAAAAGSGDPAGYRHHDAEDDGGRGAGGHGHQGQAGRISLRGEDGHGQDSGSRHASLHEHI